MKNNKAKIFFQLIKGTPVWKALVSYIIAFFVIAAVITLAEPNIERYIDGIWYSFVSCTTIGFGDFTAVTLIGRIATVVLYILTILILALITAFFTQFFIETSKADRDESVALFAHDLEHLEDLPKERLKEISDKVKKIRSK